MSDDGGVMVCCERKWKSIKMWKIWKKYSDRADEWWWVAVKVWKYEQIVTKLMMVWCERKYEWMQNVVCTLCAPINLPIRRKNRFCTFCERSNCLENFERKYTLHQSIRPHFRRKQNIVNPKLLKQLEFHAIKKIVFKSVKSVETRRRTAPHYARK